MITIDKILNKILQGHVLDVLQSLPKGCIDLIVTSPPYYALRDYETTLVIWDGELLCEHEFDYYTREKNTWGKPNLGSMGKLQTKDSDNFQVVGEKHFGFCKKCNAWLGQLGLEPNLDLYLAHLHQVFIECRRVLKNEGSLWVNLGDTYAGSGTQNRWNKKESSYTPNKKFISYGNILDKSLLGVPDRFKINMIDGEWICRNDIIWHKPDALPSPIKDRFTNDYERFFFFTKQKKYYFEQQLEEAKELRRWGKEQKKGKHKVISKATYHFGKNEEGEEIRLRNKRAVWNILTASYSSSHFAVFPEELVKIPILACCPPDGVVLDCFFGRGTTGRVARELGRNYIGIDLNEEYIHQAKRFINQKKKLTEFM